MGLRSQECDRVHRGNQPRVCFHQGSQLAACLTGLLAQGSWMQKSSQNSKSALHYPPLGMGGTLACNFALCLLSPAAGKREAGRPGV